MDHTNWFSEFKKSHTYSYLTQHPIVYFCAEFALWNDLHTYAGGLGVLSADYLREASDQDLPVVAIGLYYPEGYVSKELSPEGVRVKMGSKKLPESTGLTQVIDQDGTPLTIRLPLLDYHIYLHIWKWDMGSVTVYFLDPNVSQNNPSDRGITSKLYDADKQTRLKQEIILGIGGFRFLKTLGITPSLFHLNEGHSAFLALEMIHEIMQEQHISFSEAVEMARSKIVFTNHTLVQAGNDTFSQELTSTMLNHYAQELLVSVTEIVSLGLIPDSNMFSMTNFALSMARKINAVSSLHAKNAASIWPRFPMETVTNGIHLPTWKSTGEDLVSRETHQKNKIRLLSYINETTHTNWTDEVLLLGWARRMVAYKRPLALLEEFDRFYTLATNNGKQLRVVYAGQAHPDDDEGEHILAKLSDFMSKDQKQIIMYLPNYDMELAKLLTSGCDIWLNTPIVGYEACGTSGMKAALNGVLSCTTADGWAHEVDPNILGWGVESEQIATSILDILEKEIIPSYYAWRESDEPTIWDAKMKSAAMLVISQFSTTRMLREYFEKLYLPLLNPAIQ